MPGSTLLPTFRVAQPFEDIDSDILMRDESGNYRLEQPMLTPSQRNEQKDDNGNEKGFTSYIPTNQHVETESQLIETYRKHQEHVDLKGLFVPFEMYASRSKFSQSFRQHCKQVYKQRLLLWKKTSGFSRVAACLDPHDRHYIEYAYWKILLYKQQ